jgi:hypothetical protein
LKIIHFVFNNPDEWSAEMNNWTANISSAAGAAAWPLPVAENIRAGGNKTFAVDTPPAFLLRDPLLELRKAEVVAVSFRQPPDLNFGAKTRVGNSTVAEVVRNYANAYWHYRRNPTEPQRHATIRAVAVNALGRTTRHGVSLEEVFNLVSKFVMQLSVARRESLRLYPEDRTLVDEVAAEVLARALVVLSGGSPAADPAGTLNYYIQPRVAARLEKAANEKAALYMRTAAELVTRQVEEQTLKQVADIHSFWITEFPGTGAGLEYALSGTVLFDDVEEMERNCPPGRYRSVFPEVLETFLERHVLVYDGEGVREVYLRQAEGKPRKVAFRGATWIYADQEPMRDKNPHSVMPVSANRHFNAWWNGDPRVVRERVVASSDGRNILG